MKGITFIMTNNKGDLVRVPENKLETWLQNQPQSQTKSQLTK